MCARGRHAESVGSGRRACLRTCVWCGEVRRGEVRWTEYYAKNGGVRDRAVCLREGLVGSALDVHHDNGVCGDIVVLGFAVTSSRMDGTR